MPRRAVTYNRSAADAFEALVRTARRLNSPGGCPWDQAQTVDLLLPHLVEETWEVYYACRRQQHAHFREELGDVFYTTLFLALLAERQGWFALDQLLVDIRRKMERWHPHVFGHARANTAAEAYRQWQAVKRRERPARSLSKRLRPLLIAVLDRLAEDPGALTWLRQTLRGASLTKNRASGSPTAASGSQARRRVRS